MSFLVALGACWVTEEEFQGCDVHDADIQTCID